MWQTALAAASCFSSRFMNCVLSPNQNFSNSHHDVFMYRYFQKVCLKKQLNTDLKGITYSRLLL